MVPCVIVVRDNVVDEHVLCRDSKHAEKVFRDKLAECLSNWDEYTQEDIDCVLDNGYEKFGNGSVCLSWAMSPGEDEEEPEGAGRGRACIVQTAIEGLTEFYPELADTAIADTIRKKVEVPETGNDQTDYEKVRDQVERLVQNKLIDGRV